MSKNLEKRNFRLKMHLACSNNDLRPALQHIYFDNGYMVSTNANILIKAKITEFSDFTEEESEILKGKFLSSDTFKKVLGCKHVVVTEDGIIDFKTKCIFTYAESEEFSYPDYNAALVNSSTEIDEIGINPKQAKQLFSILNTSDFQSCHLKFSGKNRAITIAHPVLLESDFQAIIMPTMLN